MKLIVKVIVEKIVSYIKRFFYRLGLALRKSKYSELKGKANESEKKSDNMYNDFSLELREYRKREGLQQTLKQVRPRDGSSASDDKGEESSD